MVNYPERVAARASEVRVGQILLALIAAPFYVLGFVAGVAWAAVVWIVAAVQIGFADARRRREVS